jgi:16S rRNA G1207 methylase RsmC
MLDSYKKKRIEFNFSKQKLVFDFTYSLFSSADVDVGTTMLLNSLRKNPKINYRKILDLGCGHGVISIFLKKQNPVSEVHAVDRDALALEFTKHNAELNDAGINVYPSLDYENVKDKFDLILTNFPAKAGPNALKQFVYGASRHLNKEGILALVVIKDLAKDVENLLNENIEVVFRENKTGYSIYHLRFNKLLEAEKEPYARNKVRYLGYNLETAYNVSEFESPSFATECIVNLVKKMKNPKKLTIINPFQGHSALGILSHHKPDKLYLVSRDLLSLMYSQKNLEQNGFSCEILHTSELEKKLSDLLIWSPDKKEDIDVIFSKFQKLKPLYPQIILASPSKTISQFIKKTKVKPSAAEEKNGFSAVLIDNN